MKLLQSRFFRSAARAAAVPALAAAAAAAVSDGFPELSGAAASVSGFLQSFDSTVSSGAVSDAAPSPGFHSFVSEELYALPLDRFRSDAPAGLVLVLR